MCPHFPLGLAGEGSMGSGCSRSLEHSLMHTTLLHTLQGHGPGGCSVPSWDLYSPSGCRVEVAAPMPGDEDRQGTGHAQKTMSNYLRASRSNFLWLEKLVFVPLVHAHSWMTCRSRRHNYMEMVLCLGTSKDLPLYTGRWQRESTFHSAQTEFSGEGWLASSWLWRGLFLF